MTSTQILALPTQANSRLLKGSDDGLFYVIEAGEGGAEAKILSTDNDAVNLALAEDAEASREALGMAGICRIPENGIPIIYAPTADTDLARFTAWKLAHDDLQTGETLICPSGDYYISTNFINLKSATYIFHGSRFYINASTAAGGAGAYANWTFWANSLTHFNVRGPWIIDGGSVSGKVGLVIQNTLGTHIQDIWFKNFIGSAGTTGVGLYVAGDGTKTPSKSASNIRMTGCGTGMRTDSGAEYWTFTNCHIDSCTSWGIINTGGNNQFVGCHVTLNAVGILLGGSGNAGHGSFVGGSINHGTSKGIHVKSGFPLGFVFSGTQIFGGSTNDIDLGGGGVQFNGCEIDSAITCTEAQEGIHIFRGCLFPSTNTTIDTLTVPQRANIKFYDCKTLTGAFAYNDPAAVPAYTLSTYPPAADSLGGMIFVTNETGGSIPAFSDGTDWRRVSDRAIIS